MMQPGLLLKNLKKIMQSKVCRKCKVDKPLGLFNKEIRSKDGLTARCRECRETPEQRKMRYDLNRDKILSDLRDKYRQNPKKSLVDGARARAKLKGVPFNLTVDDIELPDLCPILGVTLEMSSGQPKDNSPSLDRIIPSLGYIKGNVQVISNKANRMKNDASFEELRLLADWIYKNIPKTD